MLSSLRICFGSADIYCQGFLGLPWEADFSLLDLHHAYLYEGLLSWSHLSFTSTVSMVMPYDCKHSKACDCRASKCLRVITTPWPKLFRFSYLRSVCTSLQLNQPHALYLDSELSQQEGTCGEWAWMNTRVQNKRTYVKSTIVGNFNSWLVW